MVTWDGYMRLITVTAAMNCPPSSGDIILPMAESERRRMEREVCQWWQDFQSQFPAIQRGLVFLLVFENSKFHPFHLQVSTEKYIFTVRIL